VNDFSTITTTGAFSILKLAVAALCELSCRNLN